MTHTFRQGLDQLGMPRIDNIYRGMEDEAEHSADSNNEFQTSNYDGTRTNPAAEWDFVMNTEKDKIYSGYHKGVRMELLFFAFCVKHQVQRLPTRPSMTTWMQLRPDSPGANKVRMEGATTTDLRQHLVINGDYEVTTDVVNRLHVYTKTNRSGMLLWWCKDKYSGKK